MSLEWYRVAAAAVIEIHQLLTLPVGVWSRGQVNADFRNPSRPRLKYEPIHSPKDSTDPVSSGPLDRCGGSTGINDKLIYRQHRPRSRTSFTLLSPIVSAPSHFATDGW